MRESPCDEFPDSTGDATLEFTAAVRHLPTAFGYDIRGDVYLQRRRFALVAALHNYANHHHYFPGIEVELLRTPAFTSRLGSLLLSPRISVWLQPERQRFFTGRVAPGGLASLRAMWSTHSSFEPYLELEGKSAGWVAGNEVLAEGFAVRTGVSA